MRPLKMNNKNPHIVPASALGYSISFLLLVGLLTSGVLFLSSANKRIEVNYVLEEHLIFNNLFSLNYGASQSEAGTKQIIHPSGDTSIIVVKEWGMLRSIVATTFHKNRKLEKSALSAFLVDHHYPALYLPDHRQQLKLCGETLLQGDVHVAERGLGRGNLAKKRFTRKKLSEGKVMKSDRYLPALKKSIREINESDYLKDAVKIHTITADSNFSFTNKTSLFSQSEGLTISNRLEGNIILHSATAIIVSGSARLENVILMAPSVRFEEGFEGTVQVIARHEIICEDNVRLNYPSSLILHELNGMTNSEQSAIRIGKNAHVLGGVLLISKKFNFRKPLLLQVLKGTIAGLVYNQGDTELQGKIIGSLYTNKFTLNAGGGIYGDHLLDATISSEQLPEDFIRPNWLMDVKNTKPILLSCF